MKSNEELTAWTIIFIVLVTMFVVAIAGCAANKIEGGSHSASVEKSTSKGGVTRQQLDSDTILRGPKWSSDLWDTAVRIATDGSVQVNRSRTGTATQGSDEESHHRSVATTQNADVTRSVSLDATTQPSVTSSSLVTLDGDKVVVNADKVAQRFKAVWWQSIIMIGVGGFLCWRGRIMIGIVLILGGFAIAAYPESALVGAIIGLVALAWHWRSAWVGVDTSMKHGIDQAVKEGVITTDQVKTVETYASKKADNWLQKVSKLFS